jgi:hypothetical protein
MHSAAGAENTARYKDSNNEFVIRCLASSLEMVWYISLPKLEPALRGRTTAMFTLDIDDQTWGFEGRLVTDATTASIGTGPRTANDFAHFIAEAKISLALSLLTEALSARSVRYNWVQVPIEGAADAIKAAYAGCGIPW